MGSPTVQSLGKADLASPGAVDGGPHHASDPLVSPTGDSHQRVVVTPEHVVHLLPSLLWHARPHHERDLVIPLQQLQRHPVPWVRRRHPVRYQPLDLVQDLLVISLDLGRPRGIGNLARHHLIHRLQEFPHAHVPRGNHRHHRHPERRLQHPRLDPHPLLPGHVDHVQANDHRCRQGDQFRHQVEASFQGRRVDQRNDHLRPLPNDEFAGDDLLGRVGGQAVRARKVHQPVGRLIVDERALLPLYRLAGPVAYVLAETGEEVEERGLAHVGLAGKRHEDGALGRRPHGGAFLNGLAGAHPDLLRT